MCFVTNRVEHPETDNYTWEWRGVIAKICFWSKGWPPMSSPPDSCFYEKICSSTFQKWAFWSPGGQGVVLILQQNLPLGGPLWINNNHTIFQKIYKMSEIAKVSKNSFLTSYSCRILAAPQPQKLKNAPLWKDPVPNCFFFSIFNHARTQVLTSKWQKQVFVPLLKS